MKRIIDRPQTCDMGSGFGHYEFDQSMTLGDFLKYYSTTSDSWGVITIIYNDGRVLRKFDYDTYNNSQFYYHLSWELEKKVKRIAFSYCFMSEDVNIELE